MHKVKVSWVQLRGGGWQWRSKEFWGLWAVVDARNFCVLRRAILDGVLVVPGLRVVFETPLPNSGPAIRACCRQGRAGEGWCRNGGAM